ncbi:ESX-1 secretion-associated protein [Mycobacterium sp. BMJ-28]
MTDQERNLHVLTDHVSDLAAKQETAANQITGANRAIGDTATRVRDTHGLVCSMTSAALSAADTARTAAGSTLHKVSSELSEKLCTAASNYQNADYRAGAHISQAGNM